MYDKSIDEHTQGHGSKVPGANLLRPSLALAYSQRDEFWPQLEILCSLKGERRAIRMENVQNYDICTSVWSHFRRKTWEKGRIFIQCSKGYILRSFPYPSFLL